MSARDFIRNARAVAAVLAPGPHSPAAKDPIAGAARLLSARDLWLTPAAVAGYNPDDFRFLPTEDRDRLTAAVEAFKATATGLDGREPTPQQVLQAVQAWLAVFGPIQEYVSEPEGMAIVRALMQGEPLPDFVLGIDYTLDDDWSGDPAVWVWVIIRDDIDPESDEFQDFADQLRRRAWEALSVMGSDRIPYVRFRPESDAKAVLAGGAS